MTSQPATNATAQLSLTEFISLDGVSQAPGGPAEDTTGDFKHGGWVVPHFSDELGGTMAGIISKAGAFILGRRTYDIFASHWPHITDPTDAIAKALNTLPKFVASRSVSKFSWQGTTGIRNVAQEVATLKTKLSGDLQVHGSADLAQTLIEHDLIDEYRLFTFPVVLGSGRRLFNRHAVPATMKLVTSRTFPNGVVQNVYRRAGALTTGNVILQDDGTYRMVSN